MSGIPSWHPDPLVSRDIEQKRTNLAIKYLCHTEFWLAKHKPEHKMFHFFEKMKMVLSGKVSKLSIKLLEGLEASAKKFLEVKSVVVDLTKDDDDDRQPQRSSEEVHVPDSPPHSPLPETGDDASQCNLNNSSFTQPVPEKITYQPIELPDLPAVIGSCLDSPLSDVPTTPALPPQRRKSILSGSVAKEQSSIGEYKIKHKILKPPAIYAKPKEQDISNRHIVSVPYKNPPRPAPPPMDPKDEAEKLAGIKDRIHIRNYLHIDAAKKEKMQKEAKEMEPETSAGEEEEETSKPKKKPRRNSVAVKKQKKEVPKLQVQRGRPKEKLSSSRKPRSKSQSHVKKKPQVIYSDSDDDSYVAPDHVYEDIQSELADIFGEGSEKEVEVKQPEMKKRRQSIAAKKQPEKPSDVPQPSTSSSSLEPMLTDEPSKSQSQISFSQRRLTRSKSMFIVTENEKTQQLEEPQTLKAPVTLEIRDVPISPVKKKPPPKPKVAKYPKTLFARKRGRPAMIKNNIVPQAATDALKLPSDIIFSPPQKMASQCALGEEDLLDESLLVEVPGSMKTLKRTTELRPRKRRAEIDEPPPLRVVVKEEPTDSEM